MAFPMVKTVVGLVLLKWQMRFLKNAKIVQMQNLPVHVLDVIDHMVESSEKGAFVQVTSTCKRPEPMPSYVRRIYFEI